jgi:hypothetical protein
VEPLDFVEQGGHLLNLVHDDHANRSGQCLDLARERRRVCFEAAPLG